MFGYKNIIPKKRTAVFIVFCVALTIGIAYFSTHGTLTINPLTEHKQQKALLFAKTQNELSPFTTDGCSAGLSDTWREIVGSLSESNVEFDSRYADAMDVPFEEACVTHDRAYHEGIGGYAGRLAADNQLRTDILQYAIDNTKDIKNRTNLKTDEQALFLYEGIAEATYRGVRLGGAPCTNQTYAWGFGYGGGDCGE